MVYLVNKRKIERFTSTSAHRGGKTMKKEKAERDPAWSRSRPKAKKKTKMCSRASLRLLSTLIRKKRTVDRNREQTVCVTRTVEHPSIQNNVGDEESKLLFMIALGLMPNSDVKKKTNGNGPFICLKRLDPKVESEARARTREKIFQIFQERKLELLHRRIASVPVHDKVEVVDLVSSDDEATSDEVESDVESRTPDETYRNPLNSQKISHYRTVGSSSPLYRILTPSQPRKPVFKPIANNQESGVFRNWKPESMKKLMNSNQNDSKTEFAVSSSKLLSSLKNVPKNTTLTKSFTTKIPTGTATSKTHLHVVKETEKGVPNIMIPTAIITID